MEGNLHNGFSGNPNKESERDLTIKELESIKGEVYMMGANDREIHAINDIILSYKNGEIPASIAIEAANRIKNSKSDYH